MDETNLQGELERLHAASFGWALWCCGHRRDEAEEVLQISYLKVLERTATFDGRSSLRTWFFGVIRRTAAERRRRQWLRRQIFDRWLAIEPSESSGPLAASPEAAASQSENSRNLLRAVAELSARQRQVLHLVFYQDLTVEEASQVMTIPLGTARTHFDRGKRRLRDMLSEQEAFDERR